MSRRAAPGVARKPGAPPDMPYIDGILHDLDRGAEDVDVLWERHLHWGYWTDPALADGSVADFAEASERLAHLVFDAARIRDGMRVLDCGCGVGGAIASLNERFSDVDLVGLNIDERQLDVARRRVRPRPGNRIEFVHADACELPFAHESFDAVLALECIPHFPSRRRFLREARRVLPPGGRLGITDIVPLGAALPLLVRAYFSLGFYGEVNPVQSTVTLYRVLARRAGLKLRDNDDITHNTLPTFDVLGPYFGTIAPEGAEQTRRLVKIFRRGLMRYRLLSFERS